MRTLHKLLVRKKLKGIIAFHGKYTFCIPTYTLLTRSCFMRGKITYQLQIHEVGSIMALTKQVEYP